MIRATVVAAVMLIGSGVASADRALLDEAQRNIDDVDYAAAKRLVDKALAGGEMTRSELARAHRIAGEVSAAFGDAEAAKDHFARWIVLEEGAALPEGRAPKIAAPFAAARTSVKGSLAIEVSIVRDGEVAKVVVGGDDPLGMISGIRVEVGGRVFDEAGKRAELPIGAGATTVVVVVIDAGRSELARETVTIAPKEVARVERKRGWPAAVRWPTWAGVSIVGLGVAGYFTYRVRQDANALDKIRANPGEFSVQEAEDARARGERDALIANVGFAVAGAAAVAMVLTYVLEPDAAVEVVPTASKGGAGLTVVLRF